MQSAWVILAAVQLAGLVLWTNPAAARTRASIATAAVTTVAASAFCFLSYIEHGRTIRPSSLLSLFLLLTLLFDIVRTRSLWIRAENAVSFAIAYLSVAAVVAKGAVLALESLRKTRWLSPQFQAAPPEATSGVLDRSFFWWLNPLFRAGFRRVLDVDDLFALDKHLKSEYWFPRFRSTWDRGEFPLSAWQVLCVGRFAK